MINNHPYAALFFESGDNVKNLNKAKIATIDDGKKQITLKSLSWV